MSEVMLPVANTRETATAVRTLALQHRWRITVLLVFHSCAAVFGVLAPAVLGAIIDTSVENRWQSVPGLFAFMCALVMAQTFFTWLAHLFSHRLGEFVFAQLRESVIGGILTLPFRVVQRASSGDVLARTTNDIDAVADGVRVGFPEVLIGTVTVIFTSVAAFLVDWRLAGAMVVGLPVLILSTRWYVRRSQHAYDAELRRHAVFDTAVLASVTGWRTVRNYGLAQCRADTTTQAARGVWEAENYTLRLQRISFPITQAAYYFPLAAVMMWGGWLVLSGFSTVGSVITIALYTQIIIDPMDDLLYWTDQLQLAKSAFSRMVGVSTIAEHGRDSAEPREDRLQPHSQERAEAQPVALRGVEFEYEPGRCVIGPISIDVPAKTSVAIVGPSGAGKSTLGLVLGGVYTPSRGEALLGDCPLDSKHSRSRIAVVTQERYVFTGTVRDNLLLANPDADENQLSHALTAVGATGWDIDDQWDDDPPAAHVQQLAIAQVILRSPEVVVLDEATSEVPRAQARELEGVLRQAIPDATIISIAHRLDGAAETDRILVMDEGRIVADGTHSDLLSIDGVYARLWHAWNLHKSHE